MKKIIKLIEENYIIFLVYAFLGWVYEELLFLIVYNEKVNRGFLYGPYLPVYGFGFLVLLIFLRKVMEKKHYFGKVYSLPILLFFVNYIYITIIEYTTPRIYNVIDFFSKYGLLELFVSLFTIVIYNLLLFKKKKYKFNLNPFIVFIVIWLIATIVEYVSHYLLSEYFNIILWNYSKDFLNINSRVCWDASRNFAILGTFAMYVVQPLIDKFIKKTNDKKRHIIVLVFLIPMLIDLVLSIKK